MLTESEFLNWLIYRQDAINRRTPITQPLTEPELHYQSLPDIDKLNFDKAARQFFYTNPVEGFQNIYQLRSRYYWEVVSIQEDEKEYVPF